MRYRIDFADPTPSFFIKNITENWHISEWEYIFNAAAQSNPQGPKHIFSTLQTPSKESIPLSTLLEYMPLEPMEGLLLHLNLERT